MLTNSTKQKNGKRAFTHLPFYRFLLNYYLSSSIAACAAFINDYFPIGYITGVCEVYALWYDFFLKLLLS